MRSRPPTSMVSASGSREVADVAGVEDRVGGEARDV
jgi:hypothetical protein